MWEVRVKKRQMHCGFYSILKLFDFLFKQNEYSLKLVTNNKLNCNLKFKSQAEWGLRALVHRILISSWGVCFDENWPWGALCPFPSPCPPCPPHFLKKIDANAIKVEWSRVDGQGRITYLNISIDIFNKSYNDIITNRRHKESIKNK